MSLCIKTVTSLFVIVIVFVDEMNTGVYAQYMRLCKYAPLNIPTENTQHFQAKSHPLAGVNKGIKIYKIHSKNLIHINSAS